MNYQKAAGSWPGGGTCTSNQVNGYDSASNNFQLALIQLEAGAVATTFESRDVGMELALCQRYYYASGGWSLFFSGDVTLSGIYFASTEYPVTMRAAPATIVTINSASTGFPGTPSVVGSATAYDFYVSRGANLTGVGSFADAYRADAEL